MAKVTALLVAALVAMSATAVADGAKAKKKKPKPAPAAASAELQAAGSPKVRLTLPGGKFMFTAALEANMAKGAVAKPLSIGPDLWIGAADRLSLGILHSTRAATGFLTGFGTGLCFRGGGQCDFGLGKVYTFVAGEARIGLTEGGFATAFVLGT